MRIFGIEFAPLFIPTERRLQTLGVLHYTYIFLLLGFGSLFFFLYLFLFTSYYYIPLAYTVWYYFDRHISSHGGRRSDWVRRWSLFRYASEYFPLKLVKTAELHPAKNYIFACHPHGVMSHSHFHNFATEGSDFSSLFPGIKIYLCVLSGQFMFPILRDYLILSGAIEVSKKSIEWALTKEGTGNATAIIVGGAAEALDAHPGSCRLKINSRKGFCSLALKHGADLVPVYSFGENDLYEQIPNYQGTMVRRFQDFLTQKLGFSPCFFHGRGIFNYSFGLLPHRKAVHTVLGAPLSVEKVAEPSREEIDNLHAKYCSSLNTLFETHKLKYGYSEENHLEMV